MKISRSKVMEAPNEKSKNKEKKFWGFGSNFDEQIKGMVHKGATTIFCNIEENVCKNRG